MLAIPYEAEPGLPVRERNRAVGEGSSKTVYEIWHCVLAPLETVLEYMFGS